MRRRSLDLAPHLSRACVRWRRVRQCRSWLAYQENKVLEAGEHHSNLAPDGAYLSISPLALARDGR